MSERINKLILETEFKTTGDIKPSVQRVEELKEAAKAATGETLKLVEAEKKLEQAAAQAGVKVETQTKKQTDLSKAVEKTSEQLQKVSAIKANNISEISDQLRSFISEARNSKSLDELQKKIQDFVNTLPANLKVPVIEELNREFKNFEKQIENPVSRLRELKRLVSTETDPVLLRKYTEEAAKLQDRLNKTNEIVGALASGTFFTDTIVEGAQQATAAYTTFQGAVTLFAQDNEELEKSARKAQGALALLQGTQSLIVNLKKEDNIVTRGRIVLERLYAAAVGNTTGALRVFRGALFATGIGALVGIVVMLITNFERLKQILGFGLNPEIERNIKLTREALELSKKQEEAYKAQAETLRLLADRKKQYNNDSVSGEIDRANDEIEILNREEEERRKVSEKRTQAISAEFSKLIALELSFKKKEEGLRLFERTGQATAENTQRAIEEARKPVEAQIEVIRLLQQEERESLNDTIRTGTQKIAARKTITEAQKKANTDQRDTNLRALAEEERHALALAGITSQSEETILNIKLQYAAKRLAILETIQTKEGKEQVTRIKNEIIELQAELEKISKPFAEGSLKFLQAQVDELNEILQTLGEGPERTKVAENLRDAQKELDDLRKELYGKESEDQKKFNTEFLDEEQRHQLAILDITGASEQVKLQLQIKFARERLEALKKSGQADEIEIKRAENAVTELELKAQQTREENRKEELKKRLRDVESIIGEAARLANVLISIEKDKYEKIASLQEERVRDAERLAERGNTAVLEAEQKRLDEINKKREQHVRNQVRLIQIQLVAEAALAVAKTAAETGVLSPVFIATTLLALFAGIASAQAQANSLSFRKGGLYSDKGGYTGDGSPDSESTALGRKPYTYHRKEYIMPDPVVSLGKNREWFKKIHLERIDVDKLIRGKERMIPVPIESKAPEVNVNITNKLNSRGIISIVRDDERRIKRIASKR